jgi:hypothetical protein
MAWKLADLFVQITGNTQQISATLSGLKGKLMGFASLGAQVGQQFVAGMSGGLSGLVGSVAAAGASTAAVAVAAAALAVGGLIKATMLASDFNETVAKTEQVFGTMTHVVTDAADEMAHKFGVVKTQFLDAASMFGLIIEGASVASDKAATMSVSLAKLVADASSFYNVGVDVALEKIRAGLVGEAEPLRAFGVMLSEDAVKAKALAMGLAKPGQELTNQQKIMARYQLIQEGLNKASGDLERTGGGFANQWRMFTGELVNVGTTIGQFVLPVFTALLRQVNAWFSMFGTGIDWIHDKWEGFLDFLGLGQDKAAKAAELLDIDNRNQAMAQAQKAEEAKAQQAKHAGDQKGFQGSLEQWAVKIQEGAWGKDNLAKQGIQLQQAQLGVAQQQLQIMQKPNNGAAVALAN